MIISLGYRIKSVIATRFRQWATKRLKEYMIKGFTIDDERLKCGDEIEIICEGKDEQTALEGMVNAVESGLGE